MEALTVTKNNLTHILYFYYDVSGAPYAVKNYDPALDVWRTYLYVTNLQGDVLKVLDASNGANAVSYEYDAWGRRVSKTSSSSDYASIFEYNPFAYRGYIYDEETGFYYLQTRYYDPAIGRFINVDTYINAHGDIVSYNMFSYCSNNPIMNIDPNGENFFSISVGFSFVIFGFGFSINIAFSFSDDDWGVQVTKYASDSFSNDTDNQMIGIDIGFNYNILVSDESWVTSIHDINGKSYVTGGDFLFGGNILTNENGDYLAWGCGGSTLSIGGYKMATETDTLFSLPTINLPKRIKEWREKVFE